MPRFWPRLLTRFSKSDICRSITAIYLIISNAMNPARFIGCFLALGLLPSMTPSEASIPTRIHSRRRSFHQRGRGKI